MFKTFVRSESPNQRDNRCLARRYNTSKSTSASNLEYGDLGSDGMQEEVHAARDLGHLAHLEQQVAEAREEIVPDVDHRRAAVQDGVARVAVDAFP